MCDFLSLRPEITKRSKTLIQRKDHLVNYERNSTNKSMIFFKICSSHFCWTTSLWRRATARSISALETLWQGKFKLSFDKTKIYDLVTRCLFICFKTRASCRVLTTQLNLFPIRRHQFWIPRSYWGQGRRLAIARPPKFSSFVMISLSPSLQLVVRYQLANTFCFSWYPSYSGTIREPVGTEYCCILITFEIIAGSDPVKENL